jgi:hypothetical protein
MLSSLKVVASEVMKSAASGARNIIKEGKKLTNVNKM